MRFHNPLVYDTEDINVLQKDFEEKNLRKYIKQHMQKKKNEMCDGYFINHV